MISFCRKSAISNNFTLSSDYKSTKKTQNQIHLPFNTSKYFYQFATVLILLFQCFVFYPSIGRSLAILPDNYQENKTISQGSTINITNNCSNGSCKLQACLNGSGCSYMEGLRPEESYELYQKITEFGNSAQGANQNVLGGLGNVIKNFKPSTQTSAGMKVNVSCSGSDKCTVAITRGDSIELKENLTRKQTDDLLTGLSNEMGVGIVIQRKGTYKIPGDNPVEKNIESSCNYKTLTCNVKYLTNGGLEKQSQLSLDDANKEFDNFMKGPQQPLPPVGVGGPGPTTPTTTTGIRVTSNCKDINNCSVTICRGEVCTVKDNLNREQTDAELKKASDEIGGNGIEVSRTSTFIPEYYPSKEKPQERKLASTCNYKSMTCQVEYSINGASLFKGELPKSENDKAFDDMETDKGPLVAKINPPLATPETTPPIIISDPPPLATPTPVATSVPIASPTPFDPETGCSGVVCALGMPNCSQGQTLVNRQSRSDCCPVWKCEPSPSIPIDGAPCPAGQKQASISDCPADNIGPCSLKLVCIPKSGDFGPFDNNKCPIGYSTKLVGCEKVPPGAACRPGLVCSQNQKCTVSFSGGQTESSPQELSEKDCKNFCQSSTKQKEDAINTLQGIVDLLTATLKSLGVEEIPEMPKIPKSEYQSCTHGDKVIDGKEDCSKAICPLVIPPLLVCEKGFHRELIGCCQTQICVPDIKDKCASVFCPMAADMMICAPGFKMIFPDKKTGECCAPPPSCVPDKEACNRTLCPQFMPLPCDKGFHPEIIGPDPGGCCDKGTKCVADVDKCKLIACAMIACPAGEVAEPLPKKPGDCCTGHKCVPKKKDDFLKCTYAVLPRGASIGTTFKGEDMATLQAKCDKYCKEASDRNPGLRRRGAVCVGGTGAAIEAPPTKIKAAGGKTIKNCDNVKCSIPAPSCSGAKLVSDGDCCSKWQCP